MATTIEHWVDLFDAHPHIIFNLTVDTNLTAVRLKGKEWAVVFDYRTDKFLKIESLDPSFNPAPLFSNDLDAIKHLFNYLPNFKFLVQNNCSLGAYETIIEVLRWRLHFNFADCFCDIEELSNGSTLNSSIPHKESPPVCECGAEQCGCGHSTWCPLFK